MAQVVPDFSIVTFLPEGQRAKLTNPNERTDLLAFFNAVINQQKLEVDEEQLQQIFCMDLTIDTKQMDKRLTAVLGEALVYYMTVWPGWQRSNEYFGGQLLLMEWYKRFRQYLIFKSNFIIKNIAKFAVEMRAETTSTAVQTDNAKRIAPYVLSIEGPPSVLNNVVFMASNDDIIIKQYAHPPWQPLRLHEFVNWLYVSVEVNLPDIGFVRNNTHKFQRYIARTGNLAKISTVNPISFIKRTKDTVDLQPYSWEFFQCYFMHFLQLLRIVPGVNAHRLKELETLFTEFIFDIKEVNVYNCTMCTDISIEYHIGKCQYIRNKRMVRTDSTKKVDENSINFYEILIPQMNFILNHFNVVQDLSNPNVSFESTNKIWSLIATNRNHPDVKNLKWIVNETCLVYRCNMCKASFSTKTAYSKLVNHFDMYHKAEQALLCLQCRKQFSVQSLVAQRWTHTCMKTR